MSHSCRHRRVYKSGRIVRARNIKKYRNKRTCNLVDNFFLVFRNIGPIKKIRSNEVICFIRTEGHTSSHLPWYLLWDCRRVECELFETPLRLRVQNIHFLELCCLWKTIMSALQSRDWACDLPLELRVVKIQEYKEPLIKNHFFWKSRLCGTTGGKEMEMSGWWINPKTCELRRISIMQDN